MSWEDEYGVIHLTAEDCAEQLESIFQKWPGLRDFKPEANASCCQRDEVADEFGWDAAWAWDSVKFLRGEDE